MLNLIELMNNNFERIITISAWGASESKKELPNWFRWLIENSNIKYAYQDHERQEELLIKTNLKWTIIRPVGLTNSTNSKDPIISINGKPKPNLMISRKTVASFVSDCLKKEQFINQIPTISE